MNFVFFDLGSACPLRTGDHDDGVKVTGEEGSFRLSPLRAYSARPPLSAAAEYKHSGCAKAAKLEFPTDPAARKDFKHWFKYEWKAYKASHP